MGNGSHIIEVVMGVGRSDKLGVQGGPEPLCGKEVNTAYEKTITDRVVGCGLESGVSLCSRLRNSAGA